MSTLHMRYEGNVIDLDESIYNPSNYGTARLNIKVNNNSTAKLGLTTNTNAQEYCKLKIRLNGNICYIGRSMTTSYISGNNINYNGSSSVNRNINISTGSNYYSSEGTSVYPTYSSSMQTSTGSYTAVTSQYTQVTSTQQVETSSQTVQVWTRSDTQQVWTRSDTQAIETASQTIQVWTRSDTQQVWTRSDTQAIETASQTIQVQTSSSIGTISANYGYLVGTYNYNPGYDARMVVGGGASTTQYTTSRTGTEWVYSGSRQDITGAESALLTRWGQAYATNNWVKYATYTATWANAAGTLLESTSTHYQSRAAATASQNLVYNSVKSTSYVQSLFSRTVSSYTNGWKASTQVIFTSSTKYSYSTVCYSKTQNGAIANKAAAETTASGGVGTVQVKMKFTTSASTTKAAATGSAAGSQTQNGASYTRTSSSVQTQLRTFRYKTAAGSLTRTTSSWTRAYSASTTNTGTVGYSTYSTKHSVTNTQTWGWYISSYTKRWSAWADSYIEVAYRSYSTRTDRYYSTRTNNYYSTQTNNYYSTQTNRSYSTRTNNYYSTQTNNYYSTRTDRYYSTASSTGTTYYTGSTYYTSVTRSTTSVSETLHNCNV